jgi:hypothetical protein
MNNKRKMKKKRDQADQFVASPGKGGRSEDPMSNSVWAWQHAPVIPSCIRKHK